MLRKEVGRTNGGPDGYEPDKYTIRNRYKLLQKDNLELSQALANQKLDQQLQDVVDQNMLDNKTSEKEVAAKEFKKEEGQKYRQVWQTQQNLRQKTN